VALLSAPHIADKFNILSHAAPDAFTTPGRHFCFNGWFEIAAASHLVIRNATEVSLFDTPDPPLSPL
jgi:hypothetical protein